jgi:hypothetical protein
MATNHDDEQLPVFCPFDGAIDLIVNEDDGKHYMLCLQCYSCGPTADTYEEAIAAWCDRYNPEDNMRVYRRSARTIALDS